MKRKVSPFTTIGIFINATGILMNVLLPRFTDLKDGGWISTSLLIIGCAVICVGLYISAKENKKE